MAEASPAGAKTGAQRATGGKSAGTPPAGRRGAVRLKDLPNYARSLLRIQVPVVVTLAQKRMHLGRVLEWGPGSLIQFDKSCEEMLELSAGGHPIAVGEAVKVGDKFGLRITSMILPDERFQPVRPQTPPSAG
ncbi:MAG: FliM/FliN family flagellar motor C-terminal domain-containing protein [Thermoguttaceae bacterium]|jgi:flagellar motor switch/type III secretory pathway protein FliN|nr:FliM/FliN family flagellar motor C-terminal domain-containing protein [Thermoguttaceae bacterium]